MPPKARPPADNVEKPTDPIDTPPAAAASDGAGNAGGDGPKADTKAAVDGPSAVVDSAVVEPPAKDDAEQPEPPRPGVYRFTWPYACNYLLPDRKSAAVEPGTEVFWPDGPPDALWEFVSDQPAPAPSDNTEE